MNQLCDLYIVVLGYSCICCTDNNKAFVVWSFVGFGLVLGGFVAIFCLFWFLWVWVGFGFVLAGFVAFFV